MRPTELSGRSFSCARLQGLLYPSTFSLGLKIRNSHSTQNENDRYNNSSNPTGPFTLDSVLSNDTNPTYYNNHSQIHGQAYGPMSSYSKILSAVAANPGGFQTG